MGWRAVLVMLVLGPVSAGIARADGARLEWTAPEGCPGAADVEAPPGGRDDLTVRVQLERTEAGAVAIVETRGPERSSSIRQFAGPTCAAVAEAAALYLAVARGYAPAPVSVHESVGAPVTAAGPTGRLRGQLSLATVAEHGSLPGFGVGGQAALAVSLSSVRVAVEAAGYRGERVSQPDAAREHGADFRLIRVGASGCYRPGGPVWLCATGEVGRLSATPYGTRAGRSPSGGWLALGGGLEVRHRVFGAIDLFAAAHALVPVRRDEFRFDDSPILHRPGSVVPRMTLGVSWSLFSLQR